MLQSMFFILSSTCEWRLPKASAIFSEVVTSFVSVAIIAFVGNI
ncbi:hypothetical protein PH505_bb00500 [Pseudoalteromonas distincta]|nr:hypothetical protein PH505_bb00500 [Pseudoalteromonas distincta]